MNILELFRKKNREEKTNEPEEEKRPDIYSGMRVEVTSFDNRMLFEAKIMNPRGSRARLLQYSEALLPSGEPPYRVQIRGYNPSDRKAVYMEGAISPLPQSMWLVEELVVVRVGNDRAFFRLETNLEGSVTTLSGGFGGGEHPCRLLNISVGGACVSCGQRFHEGDRFLLKAKLMQDRDTSIVFCEVVRAVEKDTGRFEYGCRFLELNSADEERITQNIFASQRKKRNV